MCCRDFEASERAAVEALSGDPDGASVWIAICAESFTVSTSENEGQERLGSRPHLMTVIADRIWDKSQRNLGDSERAMLASHFSSDQISLKDFSSFWSFYVACEVRETL